MSIFLRHRTPVFVLAFAALFFVACDSGGGGGSNTDTGTVTGRITAADGTTPISGATVGLASSSSSNSAAKSADDPVPLNKVRDMSKTVDTNGPTTTTNANGEYTLNDVPSGNQTLAAKKGAFEVTFSVDVETNETVESDDNETRVQPAKKLGVVLGSYDSIEEIIAGSDEDPEDDGLGYGGSLDTLQTSDLSNSSILDNYGIIFVNCGAGASFLPDDRVTALRNYIDNGGTLYVSDLEQDYAEEIYPGTAAFNSNTGTQTVRAGIETNDLEQFVGKDSVDIAYDLAAWERVTSVSDTTSYPTPEPLLSGQPDELSSGSEPLAITYDADPGRLVYTTFHNEAGATADQRVVLKYYVFLP
jgi:hypothetical protein